MKNIIAKQNEEKFIDYLKAQRIAYSQCKQYQILDVISIIIAVVFPIVGLMNNNWVNHLGAFGVLWTIVYLVAENYRKKKTEQGARIQEQFDTELFELNWNGILCKSKINKDEIYDLAKRYKKNDLKNWYSIEIGTDLQREIAILLCQRINFSWELGLRKLYVRLLVVLLLIYYGIFIVFFIYKNIGIYDSLLLLSPSLSFLIYGIQNSLSLKSHINSKSETLEKIDSLLENYSFKKDLPEETFLRQIQDVIYTERTIPEKIPDWFYKLNKKNNETKIDELVKTIKQNF